MGEGLLKLQEQLFQVSQSALVKSVLGSASVQMRLGRSGFCLF